MVVQGGGFKDPHALLEVGVAGGWLCPSPCVQAQPAQCTAKTALRTKEGSSRV